ncbi:MAG: hypothetical protein GYB20_18240 [Oceanospirillales bacterium]|nr:hypothetical protein [Oceanospirillales bacterium]MBR9889624.1 hypothetical protein [Oceanospirillales bacterium]
MTEQTSVSPVPQNQINLSYDSVEDRILIRACENGKEYRAWWTRRLALRLFKLFQEHTFPTENSASHLQPDQQQNLGEIEKYGAVQQADFSTPFREGADQFPLGESGILVQRVDIKTEGKLVRFVMLPAEGEGMTLSLPPGQRYSFEHMLQRVMVAAEWLSEASADGSAVPDQPPLTH